MADGWYEWVKDPDDPKKKQPFFIRLKSQAPMFFAALAEVHPGLEPHEGDGFVIITSASDQGMVDIHDRRPLGFSSEHAREWVENDLNKKIAEELMFKCCQPTKEFEWYPRFGAPTGPPNRAELVWWARLGSNQRSPPCQG